MNEISPGTPSVLRSWWFFRRATKVPKIILRGISALAIVNTPLEFQTISKVLFMDANGSLDCTSLDMMAPLLLLLRSRWFFRRATKVPKIILRGISALWQL